MREAIYKKQEAIEDGQEKKCDNNHKDIDGLFCILITQTCNQGMINTIKDHHLLIHHHKIGNIQYQGDIVTSEKNIDEIDSLI